MNGNLTKMIFLKINVVFEETNSVHDACIITSEARCDVTVAKKLFATKKHARELQIWKLQVFIGYIINITGFFKDYIGLKI